MATHSVKDGYGQDISERELVKHPLCLGAGDVVLDGPFLSLQVFARGLPSLLRNTSVSHALVTSLTDGREALCLCGFFFFASTVLTVYITVNSHW